MGAHGRPPVRAQICEWDLLDGVLAQRRNGTRAAFAALRAACRTGVFRAERLRDSACNVPWALIGLRLNHDRSRRRARAAASVPAALDTAAHVVRLSAALLQGATSDVRGDPGLVGKIAIRLIGRSSRARRADVLPRSRPLVGRGERSGLERPQ